ncbi:adenylyltransferase/cytidyltransferase family protein [Streptomyces sp. NPDC002514]|uniref:adenylyltransferase/cytidyltransferase family protein n=1 Tax=Streptomyces sp. NPDC001270 TaxID=3364554 RepID=UPI00369CE710
MALPNPTFDDVVREHLTDLQRAAELARDAARRGGSLVLCGAVAASPPIRLLLAESGLRSQAPHVRVYGGDMDPLGESDVLVGLAADDADDSVSPAFRHAAATGTACVLLSAAGGPAEPHARAAVTVLVVADGRSARGATHRTVLEALLMRAGLAPGQLAAGTTVRLADLVDQRGEWRARGRTVVWTNGCFDLLHAGHIGFLDMARALGDVLIVGVNTDAWVRRLKGPDRPFVPFASRTAVLHGLRAVDHVVAMAQDTPLPEIEALRPDVCVKDDSYAYLPMPEREVVESYGGRVRLLPRIPELSTSLLAEQIRTTRA